jgi:hypothetical protein
MGVGLTGAGGSRSQKRGHVVGIRIFGRQWIRRRLQMGVLQELLNKPVQPDIALHIAGTV